MNRHKAVAFCVDFKCFILADVNYYDDFDFSLIDIFTGEDYGGKSYIDNYLYNEIGLDFISVFGLNLSNFMDKFDYYISFYKDKNDNDYYVFVFIQEIDFYQFLLVFYNSIISDIELKNIYDVSNIYKLLEKHIEIFV